MDTCFFCHQAIENEDEHILTGLAQDEVIELVPAHQDCADPRSDHVEPDALLGDLAPDPHHHCVDVAPHGHVATATCSHPAQIRQHGACDLVDQRIDRVTPHQGTLLFHDPDL